MCDFESAGTEQTCAFRSLVVRALVANANANLLDGRCGGLVERRSRAISQAERISGELSIARARNPAQRRRATCVIYDR